MNREVLSKYNMMTVAEGMGVSTKDVLNFVDADRKELNMAYHFEGMGYGYLPGKWKTPDPKGYDLVGFKQIYSRWDSTFAEKGWGTIYLGNHDQPRMVTRWGNDNPAFREYSSKMLTTFLMTMRGTPYYYFGDELGMTNAKFSNIADYRDIETLNMYRKIKNEGGDLNAFIESQKNGGARDNGRTPMQWSNSSEAGFTSGTPWIKVNTNYSVINVSDEEKDPQSTLNYFREIVKLRKTNPVLIYGKYTLLDSANPSVYSYIRELNGEKVLIMLNFKSQDAQAHTGLNLKKAKLLVGNYRNPNTTEHLRPYEAVVLKLN
jgi:oligo-1,6-glucosidase